MDKRKRKERRVARGREVSSTAQRVLFVSNVSLLGFRRHTVLLVLRPPPQPFPHTSATTTLLGNPPLDLRRLCPRLLTPKGAAITVTDTSKPRVGGFGCSSSYPADCEAGCTLTVVPFLIKGCGTIVVAFGERGVGGAEGGTRQGFVEMISRGQQHYDHELWRGLQVISIKKCFVINI